MHNKIAVCKIPNIYMNIQFLGHQLPWGDPVSDVEEAALSSSYYMLEIPLVVTIRKVDRAHIMESYFFSGYFHLALSSATKS